MQGLRAVVSLVCCLAGCVGVGSAAGAQSAIPRRPTQTVKVDVAAAQFESGLPFRETFWARGTFPTAIDSVNLIYGVAERDDSLHLGIARVIDRQTIRQKRVVDSKDFVFRIQPLEPNVRYLFRFLFYGTEKVGPSKTDSLVVDTLRITAVPKASIAQHFDADVGLLRSEKAGMWAFVTSSHFHLVPVNKNADMTGDGGTLSNLANRLSVFAGVAFQEIYTEEEVTKFFGFGSPVAGVGIRGPLGLDPIRLNGGLIWFKQKDANPLVSRQRIKHDAFVSATADLELKQMLGPLAAVLGVK